MGQISHHIQLIFNIDKPPAIGPVNVTSVLCSTYFVTSTDWLVVFEVDPPVPNVVEKPKVAEREIFGDPINPPASKPIWKSADNVSATLHSNDLVVVVVEEVVTKEPSLSHILKGSLVHT